MFLANHVIWYRLVKANCKGASEDLLASVGFSINLSITCWHHKKGELETFSQRGRKKTALKIV